MKWHWRLWAWLRGWEYDEHFGVGHYHTKKGQVIYPGRKEK